MPSVEEKMQKLANLLEQVESGTKEVFTSGKYETYLKAMARFHSYSFRNVLLIQAQCPQASRVAGFNTWKSKFHRTVKKSEKGIQIIGYTGSAETREQTKRGKDGQPIMGANGQPMTETVTVKIPHFAPMYIFDVSQTAGEPLPSLTRDLTGDVAGYEKMFLALSTSTPYSIA